MQKIKNKDSSWQFLKEKLPIDLSPIINDVLNFDEEWKLDTSRQDKLTTHKDTRMYQLRFISYLWQKGEGNNSININNMRSIEAQEIIEKIYLYLEEQYNGKVVRCEIIDMNGQGFIATHVDSGEFLSLGRRIHIPLITNKDVLFTVFNNTINMEVGNWYEINNSLPHSVKNNSNTRRIHIILDILSNEYLK
jgi:hypothetical protein